MTIIIGNIKSEVKVGPEGLVVSRIIAGKIYRLEVFDPELSALKLHRICSLDDATFIALSK